MPVRLPAFARLPCALLLSGLALGCPAVYPELGTRTRAVPAGQPLDPPPPEGVRFLRVLSARVPEKDRGGHLWRGSTNLAHPFAKVFINGKEIFRTEVQGETSEPTWPKSPSGNFKFGSDDKLKLELWHSSPLSDQPICIKDIGRVAEEQRMDKQIRASCDDIGAEVTLAFEPAHAVFGAGLWYELRTSSCYVTRMLLGSPAERAGLVPGDEIVEVKGRKVQGMTADELRSVFNAIPVGGLPLVIKHDSGAPQSITLSEGPIYPLYQQYGVIN